MIETIVTLCLAQTPPGGPNVSTPNAAAFFPFAMMIAVVAFIFLSARSQKKREKREREDMYSRLSKNDRVQTIGGIVATVVSVKDNEVVLKVDESTNTKITFLQSAIQRIVTDEAEKSTK